MGVGLVGTGPGIGSVGTGNGGCSGGIGTSGGTFGGLSGPILVLMLERAAGIDGSPILSLVIMELFKALVNGLFFEHEQEYN
jgi:hypothetical protein